jgi:hypothetical protein
MKDIQHNVIVVKNVIILSVIQLTNVIINVRKKNAVILSAIMLIVVAPRPRNILRIKF